MIFFLARYSNGGVPVSSYTASRQRHGGQDISPHKPPQSSLSTVTGVTGVPTSSRHSPARRPGRGSSSGVQDDWRGSSSPPAFTPGIRPTGLFTLGRKNCDWVKLFIFGHRRWSFNGRFVWSYTT